MLKCFHWWVIPNPCSHCRKSHKAADAHFGKDSHRRDGASWKMLLLAVIPWVRTAVWPSLPVLPHIKSPPASHPSVSLEKCPATRQKPILVYAAMRTRALYVKRRRKGRSEPQALGGDSSDHRKSVRTVLGRCQGEEGLGIEASIPLTCFKNCIFSVIHSLLDACLQCG